MKFFARLVMFSLAAGVSLATVAGDAEDCENYFIAEDYKRAFPVCSRAAKQGDVLAQFGLGWMYYDGEGVSQNDREAVKWFRLAAEQGVAKAQGVLGAMYDLGEGVTQDYQEAYIWYSLAVANGFKDASKLRDIVAKSLTVSELQTAQQEAKKRFQEIESRQSE